MRGGGGDDELRGGKGADNMSGGAGADTFSCFMGADFRTATDDDVVRDFTYGEDQVQITAPTSYIFDVETIGNDLVVEVSTRGGTFDRGSITFRDLGGLIADGEISATELEDALNFDLACIL